MLFKWIPFGYHQASAMKPGVRGSYWDLNEEYLVSPGQCCQKMGETNNSSQEGYSFGAMALC